MNLKQFLSITLLSIFLFSPVFARDVTYRNVIENFETSPVYLDTPGPNGWYFKSTTTGGTYTWEIDPTRGANGTSRSLKMTVTEGVPFFFYLNQAQNPYLNQNAQFPVNRMRFYIKFPKGWLRTQPLPYNYNFHVGTYHRQPDKPGRHESNNWHFYYHLIFDAYDDDWIQVELNQWPQHQRSFKMNPGVNPTKPLANFNQHWTRTYFTGTPYHQPPRVGYPHNVWFDEWEFYYQNEYVATQPEYYEYASLPGKAMYYLVTITNTHPTENRRFGLLQSSHLFGSDNFWTHDVKIIHDENGDGVHQADEDTLVD